MQTLVVITSYNEKGSISELLSRLARMSEKLKVLVVDDNSPDGTGDAVRRLIESFPGRIHLIERPQKLGYASACMQGFQKAVDLNADVIVSMDADLSHCPDDLPLLLGALDGKDIVVGSRYVRGGRCRGVGSGRRLLSKLGNQYLRWILGLEVADCTSGFRVYRSEVLRAITAPPFRSRGFAVLVELLQRAIHEGFEVVEIPIEYRMRTRGKSKLDGKIFSEALLFPWRQRRF